ncbi:MAG: RNA polymerase sigma-I factor [Thermaerobacterales bacterium]
MWVKDAQQGNGKARDRVLSEFQPFALSVAAQVCGRYVQVGRDEEVSVALMALDEAIDRFDDGHGGSFLGFAQTVIRRRLVDHYRRSRRARAEIPLSDLEWDDEEGQDTAGDRHRVLDRFAVDHVEKHVEAWERREEIAQYALALEGWGIKFAELPRLTPRHRDARQRAIAVARLLAGDGRYTSHVRAHGSLPLKALAEDDRIGVSRKTLERQRKYILAITMLLIGDFEYLQAFVGDDGPGPEPDPDRAGGGRG